MIHRSKRPVSYTIVSNGILQEENLSLPAIGLLVFLLQKPDNWEVYPKYLASKLFKKKNSKAGYRYLLEIINELEEFGYCKKNKKFDGSVDYFIFDEPDAEKQQHGKPNAEILQYPDAEKPHVEIPHHIINTNLTINTNSLSCATELHDTNTLFEEFWKLYPRKSNKSAAKKKFNHLSTTKQKHIITLTHYFLDAMKDRSEEFIPMATTYLNQERYLDYEQEHLKSKSEISQPKEGTENKDAGVDELESFTQKVLTLVKMYKETQDKATLNQRSYESFKIIKEGVKHEMFTTAEIAVLQTIGADIKAFTELEWQDGEIKRLLKGYIC